MAGQREPSARYRSTATIARHRIQQAAQKRWHRFTVAAALLRFNSP
jgi:hypothetical protein